MRERMMIRLDELQSEMDAGTRRLQELEREQTQLHEVMLRISGAMQVLRELLGGEAPSSDGESEPVAVSESNGHGETVPDLAAGATH